MEPDITTAGFHGRPGGFSLTGRAVELGGFKTGSRVLDLGCGSGATVAFLRKEYGIEATGLDKDPGNRSQNPHMVVARAEEIPFSGGAMDGILMECSFSLMDDRPKVLEECYRVLTPGGRLVVSDLYARGEPARLKGCLGSLDSKAELVSLLEDHNFRVESFDDCSQYLQTMWGQMILDRGAESFYDRLGADPGVLKRIKCGYFLLSAVKINREGT